MHSLQKDKNCPVLFSRSRSRSLSCSLSRARARALSLSLSLFLSLSLAFLSRLIACSLINHLSLSDLYSVCVGGRCGEDTLAAD